MYIYVHLGTTGTKKAELVNFIKFSFNKTHELKKYEKYLKR